MRRAPKEPSQTPSPNPKFTLSQQLTKICKPYPTYSTDARVKTGGDSIDKEAEAGDVLAVQITRFSSGFRLGAVISGDARKSG